MDHEVFLDTAYAVALVMPRDALHARALAISRQIEFEKTKLVTTRAVLMEVGNALSRLSLRAGGVRLLTAFEADPRANAIALSDDYYDKSLILFRDRPDKEWGLVDCFSFVVMRERGIKQALTADEHFEQAGFEALLKSLPT